jgi:hypothetical protein
MVDSAVWLMLVESSGKCITLLPLKEWNKVTSTVCWIQVESYWINSLPKHKTPLPKPNRKHRTSKQQP